MDLQAIHESITCPITGCVMKDPVQGNDGHTYEREAILEWLSRNQISPQTRNPMTPQDLKVNASIRFLCDKYHSGAFGEVALRPQQAPKISQDNIKINHDVKRFAENRSLLSFNVDENSFPKDLEGGYLPSDVILVVDRSGSMNAAVEAKDENGNNLENGMSVQDIVNHAARTIITALNQYSRIAVIGFDNEVIVIQDLTLMTEMNKSSLAAKVKEIKPRGQTNLWGAILEAINILDTREDKSRNSAIMAFTDGVPNLKPARGEVETLKRLRVTKNFTAPIYTFGFGYNIEDKLLYDIAKYANGATGHIPDGGMVATVFVNFCATILATVGMNFQLHVKSLAGKSTDKLQNIVMGDYPSNYNSETQMMVFDIGTIQYQQSRDIIINTQEVDDLMFYYTYKIGGAAFKSQPQTLSHFPISDIDNNYQYHINRYMVVEAIQEMCNFNRVRDNTNAIEKFRAITSYIESQNDKNDLSMRLLENLKGDAGNQGQIYLAVSNMQYFQKWGRFYLDQLSRSLNQQIKPNFKDSACMTFGGEVFNNIVDHASDIFDTLPPPEPSLINNNVYRGVTGTVARPINLAAYNNAGGGCFDSNCVITMADGTKKSLKNLEKNDFIRSVDKNNNIVNARVVCVVEIKIKMGIREMVNLEGGLSITPWHPIKYENKWTFPANIKTPIMKSCKSVITLVLDDYHVGVINGHQCIMLGHGFTEDVISHPYYGTQKVIDDLKENCGYKFGRVVINDYDVKCNKMNGTTISVSYNNSLVEC